MQPIERLIEIAVAAARRIGESHKAAVYLSKLAERCIQASLNFRAVELLSEARRQAAAVEVEFLRALPLIRIADIYLALGLENDSLTVTKDALNSARRVEEPPLKAHYLGDLARLFFRLRQRKCGQELLRELHERAEKEKFAPFEYAYRERLAVACAREGLLDRAKDSVNRLTCPHSRLRAQIALALTYAQMNEEAAFLEVTNSCRRSPLHCAVTLSILATAYIIAGKPEEARQLIANAYSEANNVRDAEQRYLALLELPDLYAKTGERERSEQILSKTHEQIVELGFSEPTDRVLLKLAEQLAKFDLFDQSLRVAQSLRRSEIRQQSFQSVAAARIEAGCVEDALRVVSIEEHLTARSVLITIIVSLYTETDPVRTAKIVERLSHFLDGT